jgi:hypothetical protein
MAEWGVKQTNRQSLTLTGKRIHVQFGGLSTQSVKKLSYCSYNNTNKYVARDPFKVLGVVGSECQSVG